MNIDSWILANEAALRLGFFLGIFVLIALWEVLAPRPAEGGLHDKGTPRSASRRHSRNRARGVGAIDLRVIGGIVVSWVVTLPIGGILAALIYFTLKGMFT